MKNIDDYLLTQDVTVGNLKGWMQKKDAEAKDKIITLIYHRFYNRYVKHVEKLDSGFLIMAVSCLMIETLESFRQGKRSTSRISEKIFKDFFFEHQESFPGFAEIAGEFYKHIRCGILHQAETTKGWRIRRDGPLLNKENNSINASIFIRSLKKSLTDYIDELNNSTIDAVIWKNSLIKLDDICENCKTD